MPGTRLQPVRVAALAVACLPLLWVSVTNSVSLVLGRDRPEIAREVGLPSAEAKAREALLIATRQPSASPQQLAHARRLAQAALSREPVNVSALVALGTLASHQGDNAQADRIFAYSEWLSRHDAATQLWLIESRVAAGDIAGALIHYSRLLSVTPAFRPSLIPILVNAARDPAVARALGDILRARPVWWTDALGPLIYQSPDPAVTLPILLPRVRLHVTIDGERALLVAGMTRLAGAGAFRQALALYLAGGGTPIAGPNLVRNGDFEGRNRLPPFDWELSNADGRSSVVQPRPGGRGNGLFLYVDPEAQGTLARQFLLLVPSRYRLSFQSGNVAGDDFQRPHIKISCIQTDTQPLVDFRLPVSSETGQESLTDFTVPAGCAAQWLSLESGAGVESQDDTPWVDAIRIQSLG